MQTILIWVLFQVYPVVQPLLLADTALTCIDRAIKIEQKYEEGEIILKCARVEVLVEGI